MTAGVNNKLPYGNLPRLLLAWVCTEAVRTQRRELILGDSLSAFMRSVGVYNGGGAVRSRVPRQTTPFGPPAAGPRCTVGRRGPIPAPAWRTSRLTVDGARRSWQLICRSDAPQARPREMASRSGNVSARRVRCRAGGGIPPVRATSYRTTWAIRPSARPMAFRDSPRRQRGATVPSSQPASDAATVVAPSIP